MHWEEVITSEDASSYDFRLRFRLPPAVFISADEAEVLLFEDRRSVLFMRGEHGGAISDSAWVSIRGSGYNGAEQALEAGRLWRGRMARALASVGRGADFGGPWSAGGLTSYARQLMEHETGKRIFNEVHGLLVHPTGPALFMGGSATASVGFDAAVLNERLLHEANTPPSEHEEQALQLFGLASFTSGNPEARFIALMMVVELLLEPDRKSDEAVALVERWIKEARSAELPGNESDSLAGALTWLTKESITSAGKKLARKLGTRMYRGLAPDRFFARCYEIRSQLVHGSGARPSEHDVVQFGGALTAFVADLLTGDELLAVVKPEGASGESV